MRTSPIQPTPIIEQAEYPAMGAHLLQPDHPNRRTEDIGYSAAPLVASADLRIRISYRSSPDPTVSQPLSHPSTSLDQIRYADMSKQESIATYLSRDAPFTAFQLIRTGSDNGAGMQNDCMLRTVVNRTALDVKPLENTVAHTFPETLSQTQAPANLGSVTSSLVKYYPTEILVADLVEPDDGNPLPRFYVNH